MFDYLRNLRLQQLFGNMGQEPEPTFNNIFGPNMPPDNNTDNNPTPMQQPQGGGLSTIASQMSKIYHPDTSAQDRLDKAISSYPQEAKPGMGRKLAGVALASLPDVNNLFDRHGRFNPNPNYQSNGQNIFDEVTGKTAHKEDVVDWKNKIAPIEQSANIERQSNSNDRQAAYQTAALELRDEAQTAKEANDSKKTAIAEHRAQVYEFKSKNPGIKFDFKGPNILTTDPITGKITDTGIPSGSMTELDKLNLQHEDKIDEIKKTGEINSNLQDKKGGQALEQIGARGQESRDTKETPSGNTTVIRPATPAATRTQQIVTARKLVNTRPDLAPFIKINGTDFTITPPSDGKSFFSKSGPSKQQYDEINNTIYGSGNNTQPNNAPQAPKGWKYIPKSGGGWTAVKDNGGIQ